MLKIKFFFVCQPVCFYSAPSPHRVPSTSTVPDNPCLHQPTSVPILPAPLSVLEVIWVGSIPIASVITPISSLLSDLSACPPIFSFSVPVSLTSAVPNVVMLSLPPVSEISPLSASLHLPGLISGLVS